MRLALLASLALLAVPNSGCTPADAKPAPPASLRVVNLEPVTVAPGDTLRYTLRWGKGARATGYRVTVSSNPTGWGNMPNNLALSDTTVSFGALAPSLPAVWDSVTFTATIVSTQGSKLSTPSSVSWKAVRAPGPPGPIIVDSSLTVIGLDVKPDTVKTLLAGQSQQFCTFIKFYGGAMALRAQDSPQCDPEYAKLPATARVVSATQQGIANVFCLTWKATGGTITVGGCDDVQIVVGLNSTRSL